MKNKTKNIKFIYFDVGGVLLRWREVLDAVAIHYDRPMKDVEEVFLQYDHLACKGEITSQEIWKKFEEKFGIVPDNKTDFRVLIIETFQPIVQTHALIKELIKKYSIGLLTNIHIGVYEESIARNLIPDLAYKVVVKSCDIRMAKPDKEIFDYAQKKAGVEGKHILFIDDYAVNIAAAKKCGWNTIQFDTENPEKSIMEIKEILG